MSTSEKTIPVPPAVARAAERDRGRRVALTFLKPSRTRQEFKDDTNVKKLLEKFMQTGQPQTLRPPQYADTTILPADFQEAMQVVVDVNQAFDSLPSKIRNELGNSPSALLAHLENSQGRQYLESLGLKLMGVDDKPISPPEPSSPPSKKPPQAASKQPAMQAAPVSSDEETP